MAPKADSGYVGRFAPSPTGALHLGTARTALLAWLRARTLGGRFLVRSEDLDRPRIVPGSLDSILRDLTWLGLDWDGEIVVQSERLDLYDRAFESLKKAGKAFACTCSRRELQESASAPQGDAGPAYPGSCRQGPSHAGRPYAWRLRMDKAVEFDDLALGPQIGWKDDLVLKRADEVYSYQLACAADDAAMGVTEVVRGQDLLPSTSFQLAILAALGHTRPKYFHVPLMLGPQGERLAKRRGDRGISDFRDQGWTPARVLGHLVASLGWVKEDRSLSLDEVKDLAKARWKQGPEGGRQSI